MHIAQGLTQNRHRKIHLAHACLSHRRMQVFGVLHDLRLYPAPNLKGTLIPILGNHAVEQIRRGIRRHKIRCPNADVPLLSELLPRVWQIEMCPEIILIHRKDHGIIPYTRPVAVWMTERICNLIALFRNIWHKITGCRRSIQRFAICQNK